MAVFERLRMSMAVPMAKARERFRKQPATCATAAVLLGLVIPIGLSFKYAFQASQSFAQKYALAEAELAASRLDRSIALLRADMDLPLDEKGQVCLPQQLPLEEQFPDNRLAQLQRGFSRSTPSIANQVLPIETFIPFITKELNAHQFALPVDINKLPTQLRPKYGPPDECQWIDPLSLELLTPSLPSIGGELRSYWFMLDESGHPLFTPERISSEHLDGWTAPDSEQWHELARVMNSSNQGISPMVVGGRNMYVAHSRLREAAWVLGLAIPHQDFERHSFYLLVSAWLVGLGGIAAATAVGLSVANHQRAEKTRGELRDRELRTERERLVWQVRQQEQQEQIRLQRDETVKTISNSMTGPLTNLKQAITLLSDYGTTLHPTQLKGYTEVMEQAIGRLAHTFDRIVSLRHLDSSSLAPRLAPVNLPQLCADLVSRCREVRHTCIDLKFYGTCGTVYLDSYLVQVALEPILRNAVKYSGNHPELPPIVFSIDCRTNDCIEFVVSDKGLGIPEQEVSEVVQPFVRGHNVYHIPGTGLGLAIAKQAIDAMDGQLHIQSCSGDGTTVTITVPIRQSPPPGKGW
ncbi:MAG: ATP-binding protein [Synechococcus sp.]